MVGRAIAERTSPTDVHPAMSMQDGRFVDTVPGSDSEKARIAAQIRGHCETKIPGYTGFVPRIKSETVCGASFNQSNLLASKLAEDRVFNPERHVSVFSVMEKPPEKHLR